MSPRYFLDSIKKKPRPPKSKDINGEREREREKELKPKMAYYSFSSTSTCEKENSVCDWIGLDPLRNTLFFSRKPRNRFSNKCIYNVAVKGKNGDLKTTYDELCCVLLLLLLLMMLSLRKKHCLDWEILERKVERERWVCVCVCMMWMMICNFLKTHTTLAGFLFCFNERKK